MKTDKNGLEENRTTKNERQKRDDYIWLAGCFIITAIATLFRFWQLELKPMHHDEGVNGHFLKRLFNEGVYQYDPSNYHGPTLYYISLAFTKVFGMETFSVRASMAIWGVFIVILTFFLRKYIGTIGSLAAALMLALSPGMVYISRYYIHEIFFVFCSMGIVLGVLYFIEGRKAGIFATAWTALLLLICFMPPALSLANSIAEGDEFFALILRIAFFAVEAALVFFVMRYLLSWDEGRPIYLILASASTALFFATKETAFITIGTLLIACFCVWIWRRIYSRVFGRELREDNLSPVPLTWKTFLERLGVTNAEFVLVQSAIGSAVIFIVWAFVRIGVEWINAQKAEKSFSTVWNKLTFGSVDYLVWALAILLLAIAAYVWFSRKPEKISTDFVLLSLAVAVTFLFVSALFFSSFFTYYEGIAGAFKAYAFWTQTGTGDHTQNGYLAYAKWLWRVESPILLLSAVGTIIAFVKARHRFAMFAGLWAFGLFLAYTIIPYKTPWLALSFTLPMCIIAGYGINEIAASRDTAQRVLAGVFVFVAALILGYQSYDLNFRRYDDDRMPYVYAHTQRGFLDLISQIEHYAEKSGRGKEATIEIVSPDYWSMPWYTRNYTRVNYHGRIVPASTAEIIVAKKGEQDDEIMRNYAAHYKYIGTYPLRPGVELYLLVRRDLAGTMAKEVYDIKGR
jgi:predicted membrane-bound mannosyltransferase